MVSQDDTVNAPFFINSDLWILCIWPKPRVEWQRLAFAWDPEALVLPQSTQVSQTRTHITVVIPIFSISSAWKNAAVWLTVDGFTDHVCQCGQVEHRESGLLLNPVRERRHVRALEHDSADLRIGLN